MLAIEFIDGAILQVVAAGFEVVEKRNGRNRDLHEGGE